MTTLRFSRLWLWRMVDMYRHLKRTCLIWHLPRWRKQQVTLKHRHVHLGGVTFQEFVSVARHKTVSLATFLIVWTKSSHCVLILYIYIHIVKNFMVLNLAWRWLFKSKHVALTYAFWLCSVCVIDITVAFILSTVFMALKTQCLTSVININWKHLKGT
jgi:hypothetical protein